MKKRKLGLMISLGVIVCILGASTIYMCTYLKAKDVDKYLTSDEYVSITKEKKYVYFDGVGNKDAIIFYPGAKVDSLAYSPIMYNLAKEGIDCYLVKMPFHFAFFDVNRADSIISNSSYDNYYMCGHSLGGAMAGTYISKTNNDIKGLIFLAAYSSSDLTSKEDLKILSIYGDKDGVLKKDKYEKYKSNLPSITEYVIEGGNHALFGSYGKQSGDNDATISLEEQTTYTVNKIVEFIND